MAKKIWHQSFLDYMDYIVNHDNYKGLSITKKNDGSYSWIAPKKSDIGKKRVEWALKKADELGISKTPGVYAKVMLEIHPTKHKVCQTCGRTLSLYYIYPNVHFISALKKRFKYEVNSTTSLYDIVEGLKKDFSSVDIKKFFIEKFKLSLSINDAQLDDIIHLCELKSRNGDSKLLGPGAMSNFPDRFDGFHTYNRCCRSTEDKGRSVENLKTYTKDRRAYEYWSDGNIHAANKYMGSSYFKGSSADHIGPISLGFIHDSIVLRKMSIGDNSTKRDRLLYEDIEEIIKVEEQYNICPISWYSKKIWEYIKPNYKTYPEKIDEFRGALKVNMANFMYILWYILENNKAFGKNFLIESLLVDKSQYFLYNYKFGENGKIVSKSPRNVTDSTRKEMERYYRVALESVYDYNEKENRNTKPKLDIKFNEKLYWIADNLAKDNFVEMKNELIKLMEYSQELIINDIKK